jgi:hypothetical protein
VKQKTRRRRARPAARRTPELLQMLLRKGGQDGFAEAVDFMAEALADWGDAAPWPGPETSGARNSRG